jgi:hypothetical protein
MTESTFDAFLGQTLRTYAEGGVRPIDAIAIAESVSADRASRSSRARRFFGFDVDRRSVMIAVAVGLLIALLGGAVLLGARPIAPSTQLDPAELEGPSPVNVAPAELTQPSPSIGFGGQAWTVVGDMLTPRSGQTATLLRNGRVLLAGGIGAQGVLTSAELWNPATGRFTETGSMTTPRVHHAAALLPDGRVLVSGGDSWPENVRATAPSVSAEIYDPDTGQFTLLRSRPMARGAIRGGSVHQVATVLADGRVFIAGGQEDLPGHATIFDPAMDEFHLTSAIPCGDRTIDTVTTLDDGRVLLTCIRFTWGTESKDRMAVLFDPVTATFSETGPPVLDHLTDTASLMADGRVLLVGRRDGQLDAVDVYDPSAGTFEAIPSTMLTGGDAVGLDDGRVLIVGRDGGQLYDPKSKAFSSVDGPPGTWYTLTVTRLLDGRVLQAGGCCGPDADAGGPEVYAPAYVFDPRANR